MKLIQYERGKSEHRKIEIKSFETRITRARNFEHQTFELLTFELENIQTRKIYAGLCATEVTLKATLSVAGTTHSKQNVQTQPVQCTYSYSAIQASSGCTPAITHQQASTHQQAQTSKHTPTGTHQHTNTPTGRCN